MALFDTGFKHLASQSINSDSSSGTKCIYTLDWFISLWWWWWR